MYIKILLYICEMFKNLTTVFYSIYLFVVNCFEFHLVFICIYCYILVYHIVDYENFLYVGQANIIFHITSFFFLYLRKFQYEIE